MCVLGGGSGERGIGGGSHVTNTGMHSSVDKYRNWIQWSLLNTGGVYVHMQTWS